MIVKRKTKSFSIVTPFPQFLSQNFTIPPDKFETSHIKIERSAGFNDQYKNLSPGNKEKVDQFIKDLETGFIYSDAKEGDGTHYLGNESKPSKGYVMFSKKINDSDRFNYLIYKPETEDGESYTMKIVLSSCFEHTISGKPGSYVSGQIGNTWKKRKKKVKKNRFK